MIKNFLIMFLWTGIAASAMADPVEPISIVVAPEASTPFQLNVSVTITNNGDKPITLSEIRLPYDWGGPLPNSQFYIYSTYGELAPYTGHLAEIASNANQYTTLAPHASVTGIVDLLESYDLSNVVNDGDRWRVSFHLQLGEMPDGDEPDDSAPDYATNPNRLRVVTSNEITVHFNRSIPAGVRPQATNTSVDEPIFLDSSRESKGFRATSAPDGSSVNDPRGTCTQEQLVALDQAFSAAEVIASESSSFLRSMYPTGAYDGSTAASALFRDYFGDPATDPNGSQFPSSVASFQSLVGYAEARYLTVGAITSAREQQKKYPIRTSCDCPPERKASVAAYLRDLGGEMTFCPAFWAFQPNFGPESQALTVLHEITHFRYYLLIGSQYLLVTATDDFAYTGAADRAYAKRTGNGTGNADTYERFSTRAMQARGNVGW